MRCQRWRAAGRLEASELCGANREQVELVLGGEPRPEALLVVGADARKLTLEVKLSHETHAYLEGHTIDGEVVVPVVLVLEWFSRVAQAFRPDLHLDTITAMASNNVSWAHPSLEAPLPELLAAGVNVVVQAAWIPRGAKDPRGVALGFPEYLAANAGKKNRPPQLSPL